jgi:hypothetical protein
MGSWQPETGRSRRYKWTSGNLKLDALLEKHIEDAEEKAEKSLAKRKYIMFGYWKAIAVHMRKIRREIRNELG